MASGPAAVPHPLPVGTATASCTAVRGQTPFGVRPQDVHALRRRAGLGSDRKTCKRSDVEWDGGLTPNGVRPQPESQQGHASRGNLMLH
jgi:hypothetical protein